MDAKAVVVLCVLLLGPCISTSGSPVVPHGYCRIVWLIGLPCERINSELINQIALLSHYQLVKASPDHLEAKHTYGDELQSVNLYLRPAFLQQGCHVEGTSVSLSWKEESDNANDYCNLISLIQRSGLSKAPGFFEFSNEGVCPGYKVPECV